MVSKDSPKHIAIIMDGNGRWAKERGLPRRKGHEAGADSVHAAIETCFKLEVSYLTLYAFSWENWSRPKAEIESLMILLEKYLTKKTPELVEKNVRLKAIGRLSHLPKRCQEALKNGIEKTKHNTGLTLVLALSYGGREEMVDVARTLAEKAVKGEIKPEEINSDLIQASLYDPELPDPDLLIRTSGEMRLSNFLLWQISYSEMVITKTLWPDFREDQFKEAVEEYFRRHRRFGKV